MVVNRRPSICLHRPLHRFSLHIVSFYHQTTPTGPVSRLFSMLPNCPYPSWISSLQASLCLSDTGQSVCFLLHLIDSFMEHRNLRTCYCPLSLHFSKIVLHSQNKKSDFIDRIRLHWHIVNSWVKCRRQSYFPRTPARPRASTFFHTIPIFLVHDTRNRWPLGWLKVGSYSCLMTSAGKIRSFSKYMRNLKFGGSEKVYSWPPPLYFPSEMYRIFNSNVSFTL